MDGVIPFRGSSVWPLGLSLSRATLVISLNSRALLHLHSPPPPCAQIFLSSLFEVSCRKPLSSAREPERVGSARTHSLNQDMKRG